MKHPAFFIHLIFFFVMITCSLSLATEVVVYNESGYSDTHFIMNIFTDIHHDDEGALISAGIKLAYPTEKLKDPVVVKNESIWYFGSPGNTYHYIEPYSDESGTVNILAGKMDVHLPASGVSGNRFMIATLTFERIVGSPVPVTSDFSLACARPKPFTNFANVAGLDLDSQISFDSSAPIVPVRAVLLRNSIRSLRVISRIPQDIPARSSELDSDGDNRTGSAEAVQYLQKASEK